MMRLIEKSVVLKREVVDAVARSGQKLDDIRCDGLRFPGQWRNLGDERASPYICKTADKWLEVRATVRDFRPRKDLRDSHARGDAQCDHRRRGEPDLETARSRAELSASVRRLLARRRRAMRSSTLWHMARSR
jgi:hypothetical protein